MNIFQKISLLLKLEKQLKNFDMKNWRTSLAGILTLALTAGHMFLPNVFTPETVMHLTALLTSLGLMAANDAKKDLNAGK